jgi:hypothetical protein
MRVVCWDRKRPWIQTWRTLVVMKTKHFQCLKGTNLAYIYEIVEFRLVPGGTFVYDVADL